MRALAAFFAATFIVSWTLWALVAAMGGGTLSPLVPLPISGHLLFLAGVFAPALVALALTVYAGGQAEASHLLLQTLKLPTEVRWYVFAAGYIGAIKLAAALIHRLGTGEWPAFGQTPLLVMVAAVVVSTPVQAGEEIGWRGYALPRLERLLGLAPASVLLGAVWACWHLPLFVLPGTDTTGQSFPVYLLSVTALSVAMAWLYWRTDGSLLLTMLMHAAINNTKDIVLSTPSTAGTIWNVDASLVGWLTLGLLWMCAAYFLAQMRRGRLAGGPAAQNRPSDRRPA